jgi:dTDP-4-dehydrorhamnose 3,5-epimerase
MTVDDAPLPGVKIVRPRVYRDERGFFLETYHRDRYAAAGIADEFVQDNHSQSVKGTIRGLHIQVEPPQAKLVRVVAGRVLDVAVDLRVGSPTFGRHHAVELSADDALQVYLPCGFAHGFAVLSEVAEVEYKCSAPYRPAGELAVRYDDPALAIAWPFDRPRLSGRDAAAPRLDALMARLPAFDQPA